MHAAVCLQSEGDCVALTEVHWSVWPCPHDSHEACATCVKNKEQQAADKAAEQHGKLTAKREEVTMDGKRESGVRIDRQERSEVAGPPLRGEVRQETERGRVGGAARGETAGPEGRS